MELFISPKLEFEKVATEAALPEDPNAWPHEILQELFKQVPYIADFDPHIVMDKVDGERGYGFGHVQVMNKTEMQADAPADAMEAAGVKQARIPIIIKDNKLQPFDVLITQESKVVPLNEERLRRAVFRPQNFDVTSTTPGDQSLIGQLYPPFRQNYGGGGGTTVSVGMGKEGAGKPAESIMDIGKRVSDAAQKLRTAAPAAPPVDKLKVWKGALKTSSVLDCILPTVHPGDLDRFFSQFEEKEVQAAYIANGRATADALKKIASIEPTSLLKRAQVLPGVIKPSVVQLAKEVEGYTIKSASHLFWEPITQPVHRGEAVSRFGEKVVLAADLNGSVTMAEGDTAGEEPVEDQPELIKDFGIYKVTDDQGRDLVGYVFPNLIDLDGTQLPMALFTNGSQSALQGEITGVRVGDAVPIHEGSPQGKGCFYFMGDSEAHATLPIEVHASLSESPEEGVAFMASTLDGREVQVQLQPNIEAIQLVDDMMIVPEHYKWLSLEGAEEVSLVSSTDDVGKEVQAHRAVATVTIRSSGPNVFSLEGMSLSKVASAETDFVYFDDALFMLGGLGVNLEYAIDKLAEASLGLRPVEVRIGRLIKTAFEQLDQAMSEGRDIAASVPDLRQNLVKEAAVIPDPIAVDTVLSLGFVNPENITSFISSMPQIEDAQERMCELLVAARLGMQDIPVSALEKAVRATEEVLQGLKVIAFQKN